MQKQADKELGFGAKIPMSFLVQDTRLCSYLLREFFCIRYLQLLNIIQKTA